MASTTAPSEAEVRELLDEHDRRSKSDRVVAAVEEAVFQAFSVITYTTLAELELERPDSGLEAFTETWADLSPRDQAELADVVELAEARAEAAALEAIRREVVAAALAFGASHPHAARVDRGNTPETIAAGAERVVRRLRAADA